MATSLVNEQQRQSGRPMRARRGRGSGRSGGSHSTRTSDKELDLLTAALIGLAVGATATLLLRRGPSGSRPLVTGLSAAGRGAMWAGAAGMSGAKAAGRAAADGTRRSVERSMDFLDDLPLDEIGDQITGYLEAAKDAIEDTVKGELQDLRKSVRQHRKRLGI